MHRRGKDDKQWQEVKKKVDIRDLRQCRLLSILLPNEMEQLKKFDPPVWMTQQIDHAHVIPVSGDIKLTYDMNNIYCLCRWAHSHIDNLIDPVSNELMTKNKQWYWWTRIRYKKTFSYNEEVDYEEMYMTLGNSNDFKRKDVMSWW